MTRLSPIDLTLTPEEQKDLDEREAASALIAELAAEDVWEPDEYGFTMVLDWMAQSPYLGKHEALTFGVVWRFAQMKEGVCRASMTKIGKRCDLSKWTVAKSLKKLVKYGYLNRKSVGLKVPNTYTLTIKARKRIDRIPKKSV